MKAGYVLVLLLAGLQLLSCQDINLGDGGPVLVGGVGVSIGGAPAIGAPIGGVGSIGPTRNGGPTLGGGNNNNQLPVPNAAGPGGSNPSRPSNLSPPGSSGGVIVVDDGGTIIPSPGASANTNNNNINNNNNNNNNIPTITNNNNNNINNNNNNAGPGSSTSNAGGDFNSFGPANFPSFGNFGSPAGNSPSFPGYDNIPTGTTTNNNNNNNNSPNINNFNPSNNFNTNNNFNSNPSNNNFNSNPSNNNFNSNPNSNNNNPNINNFNPSNNFNPGTTGNNNDNNPSSFFSNGNFPSSFPTFGGNGNANPNPTTPNNNNNVPSIPTGSGGFPDLGSINFDFGIGGGSNTGFPSNFGDKAGGFFPGLSGGSSSNFPRPGGGGGSGGGGINLPPITPTNPGSGFGSSTCQPPTTNNLDTQYSGDAVPTVVTNGVIQEASVRPEVLALANFFGTLVGNTEFKPPVDDPKQGCPANYTRLTKVVTSSNLECFLLPPPYQEPVYFATCRCAQCQDTTSPLARYGGYNNINLNNNKNSGCQPQLTNVTLVSYCPLLNPVRIVPFRLEVPMSCRCHKTPSTNRGPYNFRNN